MLASANILQEKKTLAKGQSAANSATATPATSSKKKSGEKRKGTTPPNPTSTSASKENLETPMRSRFGFKVHRFSYLPQFHS